MTHPLIKRILIIVGILVAIIGVLVAVVFYTVLSEGKSAPKKTKPAPSKTAVPALTPPSPVGSRPKSACDLFGPASAVSILGDGAVKNTKLFTQAALNVTTSFCEYTKGDQTARVALSVYTSDAKASAQLAAAQSANKASQLKGKYIVTASVTKRSVSDDTNAQRLLTEALKGL